MSPPFKTWKIVFCCTCVAESLNYPKFLTSLIPLYSWDTTSNVCSLYYLKIRLRARNFYAGIVDDGEARINCQHIKIESE